MASNNPKAPLFKAILDYIYEHGQTDTYNSDKLTRDLIQRGYWGASIPPTPERTVNSYFSQNPKYFARVASSTYRLKIDHFILPDPDISEECTIPEAPARNLCSTYRILRDTELARRIKLLHNDCCQICGLALNFKDRTYSEAHHIKPLGSPHNGPDHASNIVVLCPNHHALCDHGALLLETSTLRTHPKHRVSEKYIDYHNCHIFGNNP